MFVKALTKCLFPRLDVCAVPNLTLSSYVQNVSDKSVNVTYTCDPCATFFERTNEKSLECTCTHNQLYDNDIPIPGCARISKICNYLKC